MSIDLAEGLEDVHDQIIRHGDHVVCEIRELRYSAMVISIDDRYIKLRPMFRPTTNISVIIEILKQIVGLDKYVWIDAQKPNESFHANKIIHIKKRKDEWIKSPPGPKNVLMIDRPGFQLAMGAIPAFRGDKPPADILRGVCPKCGGPIVSNMYWHKDRGYLIRYECWDMISPDGQCAWWTTPK